MRQIVDGRTREESAVALNTLLARHAAYRAAATPDEIAAWVDERIQARYERVGEIVAVDEFPRSVAGKTLRRVVRDGYASGEAGS